MKELLVFLDGFLEDDVIYFFNRELAVAFDVDVLVKVLTLSIDWLYLLKNFCF